MGVVDCGRHCDRPFGGPTATASQPARAGPQFVPVQECEQSPVWTGRVIGAQQLFCGAGQVRGVSRAQDVPKHARQHCSGQAVGTLSSCGSPYCQAQLQWQSLLPSLQGSPYCQTTHQLAQAFVPVRLGEP